MEATATVIRQEAIITTIAQTIAQTAQTTPITPVAEIPVMVVALMVVLRRPLLRLPALLALHPIRSLQHLILPPEVPSKIEESTHPTLTISLTLLIRTLS